MAINGSVESLFAEVNLQVQGSSDVCNIYHHQNRIPIQKRVKEYSVEV